MLDERPEMCRCGCGREAIYFGSGDDFDGPFNDEPMCESAASYCSESAAEMGFEFTLRPVRLADPNWCKRP